MNAHDHAISAYPLPLLEKILADLERPSRPREDDKFARWWIDKRKRAILKRLTS